MYRALLGIGCLLCIVFSATAESRERTPGATPLNEGVCDVLVEATPGLYGLCLAFHQGMACEPDVGAADPFADCAPGSERLLQQYNKKKRGADPDMPGIQAPCPCWTNVELLQLNRPTEGDFARCIIDTASGPLVNQDLWTLSQGSGFDRQITAVQTVEDDGSGSSGCDLLDQPNGVSRSYRITHEEFLACEPSVAWSAADRGIECLSPAGE